MLKQLLAYQDSSINKLSFSYPFEFNVAIILLLLVLLLWNKKKQTKPDLIDYDLSSVLRGFAITIIIIHHLCRHVLQNAMQLSIFYEAGRVGVGLFLILSGYGLTESYRKKGLKDFFSSKLLKIYLPFVLVNIILLCLNYKLWNQFTPIGFISKIIGINYFDQDFWYMKYLFLAYCVFYCVFKMKMKDEYKVIILLMLSAVSLATPGIEESGRINAFSFVIGVASSVYKDKIMLFFSSAKFRTFISLALFIGIAFITYLLSNFAKNHSNKVDGINLLIGACMGILFLYLCKLSRLDKLVLFLFYLVAVSSFTNMLTEGFIEVFTYTAIVVAIIITFMLINNKSYSVPYKFLGDISYEIYLLHGIFMYSYDFILYKYPLEYSFFIYLILIIPLCYLAKVVFNRIEKASEKLIMPSSSLR